MDKAEAAFRWIYHLLSARKIPFVVSGGLAVRLYGGTRPLYDIDLDIPEDRFAELMTYVDGYVIRGPERFRDDLFDLLLLTLNYDGQPIDISGAESIRVFDKQEQRWREDPTDLSVVEICHAYGLPVPVQPRDLLIRYKKWIGRPTDREDVRELELLCGE